MSENMINALIGQVFGLVLLYLGCSFVVWDLYWFSNAGGLFPHERVMVVIGGVFTQLIGIFVSLGLSGD